MLVRWLPEHRAHQPQPQSEVHVSQYQKYTIYSTKMNDYRVFDANQRTISSHFRRIALFFPRIRCDSARECCCKFVFSSFFSHSRTDFKLFCFRATHFFPLGWFSIRFPFDVNYVKIRIELDGKTYLHFELLLCRQNHRTTCCYTRSVSTWIRYWKICLLWQGNNVCV